MPDSPHNPYAPPTAEPAPAAAESAQGWSVEGDYLMFRPGTQLPPVALQGRGDLLTPGMRRFAVMAGAKGKALALIPAFLLIGWLGYSRTALHGSYVYVGLLVIILISQLFVGRGKNPATVEAPLRGFFPVETLRANVRRNRWTRYLILGSFTLMGVGISLIVTDTGRRLLGLSRHFGSDDVYMGIWIMCLSMALSLGAGVWRALVPGLRPTSYRNGWVYLRGVSRESLAILAAKSRLEPPPLRKRRVVKFYQYRLPLSTLLQRQWRNPWLLLWLTIFKLTRSKNLVRLRFADRESTPLPAPDPDLLRRWEQGSRGTSMAAWDQIGHECQDSPQGDMRILSLTYGDPERRVFCTLIVVRVSVLNSFTETYQSSFQSWTENGRMFSTSSPPRPFASPPHIDAHTVSGSLDTIYRTHLARTSGLPLMTLADKDQFAQVNARDVELLNEFYEAAGYQSAPEEIDWQDVPV